MEEDNRMPALTDVYTDKPQYLLGQEVRIIAEIANPEPVKRKIQIDIRICVLEKEIHHGKVIADVDGCGEIKLEYVFLPDENTYGNFGADLRLFDGNKTTGSLSTAFDIVKSWKDAPRYGFLSEFYKEDENDEKDIKQLVKYHVNVVQLYDWMYRHEDLIPDTDYYIDPLGRKLSAKAVKDKIRICHENGMKVLAYGAVYGAGETFFNSRREWGLYKNNGAEQSFGNWLYIMNISRESPWHDHIIGEYAKAIKIMGFDGIHMDAYGWPKSAFSKLDGCFRFERLDEHFPSLIESARNKLEEVKRDAGLFFNAVSSWPMEKLAGARLDSVYIEVWDPFERYMQLNQLINRARELSGKPVILAAYLSPFASEKRQENIYKQKKSGKYSPKAAENSLRLCSAVIFASGGYHFILGEYNGVLTNNYYVDYAKINTNFERIVRNYFDFIVRFGELLFDNELIDISMTFANGINDEYRFRNGKFSSYGESDRIWTIVKEKPGFKVISLINLTGVKSDIWNEGKGKRPAVAENICITALIDEKVTGVFIASPDIEDGRPMQLEYSLTEDVRGLYIKFHVPKLEFWDLIYIRVEIP